MKAIQRKVVMMALAILPVLGWTGNRALMEQNARELIGINQAILEAMNTGIQEGEYRLSARVTVDHGQHLFQVDRFEVSVPGRQAGPVSPLAPAPGDFTSPAPTPAKVGPATPNVFAPFGRGTPVLRFGPIPNQVEMATTPAGPAAVTPSTANQTRQSATATLDPLIPFTAVPPSNPHHTFLEDLTHPAPPVTTTTGGGSVLRP